MAYNNPIPGQPQVQYPAPMVFYAAPTGNYQPMVIKNYGPHYDRQTSTGLGATQIVLACVSIASGAMAFAFQAGLYYFGIGIWAGIWYLVAGSLAIAAGKDPTNKLIIATLYFSVSDILMGVAQVISASVGLTEDVECYNYIYYDYCDDPSARVAANSTMIGVGFLEVIFGIWMTVISARAIDRSKVPLPYTIPFTYAPTQPGTVVTQTPPAVQPEPESPYEQLHFPSTHKDDLSWNSPDIADAHL